MSGARPDQTLQLTIAGRITDLTEAVAAVKANPDVGRIVIKLDSRGGDHNAASHLFNALLEHRAHCTVIVGEFCQSAALTILMAGHRRICHRDSKFMIHAPTHTLYQTAERYTAAELRRLADEVEKIADEILEQLSCIKPEHRPFIEQALMSFEGEVFGPDKAKELGLIHATTEEEARRLIDLRGEGRRRLSPIKIEATAYSKGPVSITTDPITVTWANRNRLTEPVGAPLIWTGPDQDPEAGQTTYIEVLAPDGTTVVTTHDGLTGTSFDVPWSSFDGHPSGFIRVGAERDGYRSWQAYEIQVVFAALSTGFFTLTGFNANLYANPDMTADVGTFALTGNDANLYVNPIMTAAQGTFTLTGQDAALSANNDPDFSSVSLLLGFEGADAATSTTDESPTPKTITFNGNAQLDTADKKFGSSSLLLDGTGDYCDAGASSDLYFGSGDFTIECFFKFSKSTSYLMTRHNATGNQQSMCLLVNAGRLNFFYSTNGSSSSTLAGTSIMNSSLWHHGCVDRSGTTMRIYVDGVMEGKVTGVSGALFNSSASFLIGRRPDGTANDFQGWIDEIRVTKGVARYASDSGFSVPSAAYPRS